MRLAVFILFCALTASAFTNRQFRLEFDYPAAETNVTFRAHAANDFSYPVEFWTVVVTDWTITVTNDIATMQSTNMVTATVPIQYFVVSASNEWGLVFSPVLATYPPRQNVQLKLR